MKGLARVLGKSDVVFTREGNLKKMYKLGNDVKAFHIKDNYCLYIIGNNEFIILKNGDYLIISYMMSEDDEYTVVERDGYITLEKRYLEQTKEDNDSEEFSFNDIIELDGNIIEIETLNRIINQKGLVKTSLYKGTSPFNQMCVYWDVELENGRNVFLLVLKEDE